MLSASMSYFGASSLTQYYFNSTLLCVLNSTTKSCRCLSGPPFLLYCPWLLSMVNHPKHWFKLTSQFCSEIGFFSDQKLCARFYERLAKTANIFKELVTLLQPLTNIYFYFVECQTKFHSETTLPYSWNLNFLLIKSTTRTLCNESSTFQVRGNLGRNL